MSLTGTEKKLKDKLSKTVQYKDRPGSIGTCASLTYSANAVGYIGQIGGWNDIILRPILVAMANTRNNRFWGWGGVAFIGSLANTIYLMGNRRADLNYCPPFHQEDLYGDLRRIHGVTEYVDKKGVGGVTYKYAPQPVPISTEDINALTSDIKKKLNSSTWTITELELNASLYDLCDASGCNLTTSSSGKKPNHGHCNVEYNVPYDSCDDRFNTCNRNVWQGCGVQSYGSLEDCEKTCTSTEAGKKCQTVATECTISYSVATSQLKRMGFVHDIPSKTWKSHTSPITFNDFDATTRREVVSSAAILGSFLWVRLYTWYIYLYLTAI